MDPLISTKVNRDPLSQTSDWHKALILLTESIHEIRAFQAFFFENDTATLEKKIHFLNGPAESIRIHI